MADTADLEGPSLGSTIDHLAVTFMAEYPSTVTTMGLVFSRVKFLVALITFMHIVLVLPSDLTVCLTYLLQLYLKGLRQLDKVSLDDFAVV